jgi:hypothetical protein
VVGLGRHWYDLVLRDPDNLAEHTAGGAGTDTAKSESRG